MQANYKNCIDRIITKYEGGYGWDARDPGGPTKYGITCFDLAEHRHQRMTSMAAWAPLVKAMTLQEAEDIYATKYARQCRFNDLNSGPDCVILDFGINSGSSRAIKYAQAVVGTAQDGILGPITLAAINKMDPNRFIDIYCDKRLAFLRALSTWPTFGRGWSNRVADLRAYSHNVAGKKAQITIPLPAPSGRAVPVPSFWQRLKGMVVR